MSRIRRTLAIAAPFQVLLFSSLLLAAAPKYTDPRTRANIPARSVMTIFDWGSK